MAEDFFGFAMNHNLNLIAKFHKQVEDCLSEQIENLEDEIKKSSDTKEAVSVKAAKLELEGFHKNMLRGVCFLSIFSFTEELLYLMCENTEAGIGGGSGIERFKEGIKEKTGVDLGSADWWQVLQEAADIRNCLLHANGRIRFARSSLRSTISSHIEQHPERYIEKNERLIVKEAALAELAEAVRQLIALYEV